MTGNTIRVLLVDDHNLVAQAWASILNSVENMQVVGISDNAEEAVKLCINTKPDIVLMDVNLKDSNGFDATQAIYNTLPKTKIIGLSMHNDVAIIKRFFNVGASGYISKNSDKDELIQGIERVCAGESYISADIKDKFFNSMINKTQDHTQQELTLKEIEIVKLIVQGLKSKEIADQLFISPRTVETHRHNILKKLNIPNSAQLGKWAAEKGYA